MIIAGVDPGREGAVVCLDTESTRAAIILPRFDKEAVLDVTRLYAGLAGWLPDELYMEQPMGRGGWSATGNYRIGWMGGQLMMALRLLNRPVHMVTPREWQAVWHKDFKDDTDLKPKDKTRLKYEQLFPHLPIEKMKTRQEGVLDALMIAAFGANLRRLKPIKPWEFTCETRLKRRST